VEYNKIVKIFGDKIDEKIFPKPFKRFHAADRKVLEKFGHLLIKNFDEVELIDLHDHQYYDRKDGITESLNYTYKVNGKILIFKFLKYFIDNRNDFSSNSFLYADEDKYEYVHGIKDKPIVDALTGISISCESDKKLVQIFKRDFDDYIPVRYMVYSVTNESMKRFQDQFKIIIRYLKEYFNK
tara:strand:+ start:271 stop:819 length:549 start_codon:yes stop_codon:yes gene_type:complete